MKIAVVGTGYVGLVAGACFADTGNEVICVDKDLKKIDLLKNGHIPIYEPGLEDLVARSVRNKTISFTDQLGGAIQQSDIIFFAVGTPSMENGEANLSFLKSAVEETARNMNGPKIFVNKSTVPVGTHKLVADWAQAVTSHPVDVVSNPEFLKEGTAIEDFLKPDRVVVGTKTEATYLIMKELYAPFVRVGNPIIWMDPVSAEMTKYACNAFLATKISFMNELSNLADKLGGDIESIRKGMASDARIGRYFLYAGVGYGGSCFPKDIRAILATAQKNDVPLEIVAAADRSNNRQKTVLFQKISRFYGNNLAGKTFGVAGLAFKPNTDDIREAPAFVLIEALLKSGAAVRVFDPVAMPNAKMILKESVGFAESFYDVAKGSDALVIMTEWNEFRNPDFTRLKSSLKQPTVFDGRNCYDPIHMAKNGFTYFGIGRSPVRT